MSVGAKYYLRLGEEILRSMLLANSRTIVKLFFKPACERLILAGIFKSPKLFLLSPFAPPINATPFARPSDDVPPGERVGDMLMDGKLEMPRKVCTG